MNRVIRTLASAILAVSTFCSAQAHDRTRIRVGEHISDQHHRFFEFFPDFNWGTHRDRYGYGGQGNSFFFSDRNFSVWYREPYTRRTYSPWQTVESQFLSENAGRAVVEDFFSRVKVRYIENVRLKLGPGRVRTVDFVVDLDGWVPVEYVPYGNVMPIYQQDKRAYDAMHTNKYILIPPSSTEEILEQRILNGFRENGY